VGVSFDPPKTNRAFARKQGFEFPLLSDVSRAVGARYETKRHPQEERAEWPKRRTYLIDPDGIIRKAYRVADEATHPDEVLIDLRQLLKGA
jgi:peroxiredoxin Q/BCP